MAFPVSTPSLSNHLNLSNSPVNQFRKPRILPRTNLKISKSKSPFWDGQVQFGHPGFTKMPLFSSSRLTSKVPASAGEEAKPVTSDATYQELYAWSSVIMPFVFPALGGLLFGYDIGATSGATISLTSAELSGTTWFSLSAVQLGLVVLRLLRI
jgi:hypothetical protein